VRTAVGVPTIELLFFSGTMPVTNISALLFRQKSLAQPLGRHDSYLVDSASSHMLVSKIKPCKSKFKHINGETANGSLNQLSYI
jgi:hypothetical protein